MDIKKGYIIKENNINDEEDFSDDNKEEEKVKFDDDEKNIIEEKNDKIDDDVYYKLNDIKETKSNKNNGNIICSSLIEVKKNHSYNNHFFETNNVDESNSVANEAVNGDLISIHHIRNLIINKRNKNVIKNNNDFTGNSMSKETRIIDLKNEN